MTGTHHKYIEGGSISALGVRVSIYYTLGISKGNEEYKKGKLYLADVQYIGKRDYTNFMDSIRAPNRNSLYLTHNSGLKLEPETSPRPGKNAVKMFVDDLFPDSILAIRNDYDPYSEEEVLTPVFAGYATKYSRKPVISIYRNKQPMTFVNVEVAAHNSPDKYKIEDSNATNYIVHNEKSHVHLVANPAESLEYIDTFVIEPGTKGTFTVKPMDKQHHENDFNAYVKSAKDLMIPGAAMLACITQALDKVSQS